MSRRNIDRPRRVNGGEPLFLTLRSLMVLPVVVIVASCTTAQPPPPASSPSPSRPTTHKSPGRGAERPPPPAREEARINLGDDPWGVAFGFGSVWVAGGNAVRQIDPKTNEVVATIPLPREIAGRPTVPDDPARVSLNSVAVGLGSVWVAVAGKDLSIVRIDPREGRVVSTIAAGPAPERPSPVAVGHGDVWVTNFATGRVTRIDAAGNTATEQIPLDRGPAAASVEPSGVAVTEEGVWVMNHAFAELVLVDPKTNKATETILTEAAGRVAAGAGSVWVASAGGDSVEEVDPGTRELVAQHEGCRATGNLVVGGGDVWVTEAGGICRIDPGSGKTARMPLGSSTAGVAYGAGAVWVTALEEGRLLRLEPLR